MRSPLRVLLKSTLPVDNFVFSVVFLSKSWKVLSNFHSFWGCGYIFNYKAASPLSTIFFSIGCHLSLVVNVILQPVADATGLQIAIPSSFTQLSQQSLLSFCMLWSIMVPLILSCLFWVFLMRLLGKKCQKACFVFLVEVPRYRDCWITSSD